MTMKINWAVKAALLAVPVALSGCATFHQVHEMQRHTNQSMSAYQVPHSPPVVSTVDTPYLMGTKVEVQRATPSILRLPVTIRSGSAMSLPEIASAFSSAVGVPVVLGQMHLSSKNSAGMLPPLPGESSGGLDQSSRGENGMIVDWNGSREGFLNAVAAHFSCWWKWRHGEVVFYRIETRTFTIPAFATTETSTSAISANSGGSQDGGSSGGSSGLSSGGSTGGSTSSSGGSSGGSSGSGDVSIENSSHLDVWKNLQKEAETVMGGKKKGQVFANPSMGTLTVAGTPTQINSVKRWVQSLRRQMGRQVSIVVHVYDVQENSGQSYGVSPQLAFENAAKSFGVSFQGATPPTLNSSGSSSGSSPLSVAANILSGDFSGSNVILSALANVGTVVNNYIYPVVTLNGQPVAVQSASNVGYLAETSPTVISQGVATTGGLQPGQVTTGFTAMLTPRVVGDDVYLNLNMTISALQQLQQFSSGGQTIYTPNTTSFSAPQIVKLKSGQTLLLTELVQNSGTINRNGVGSPKFFLFGGGAAASKDHQMVVITVTARIL